MARDQASRVAGRLSCTGSACKPAHQAWHGGCASYAAGQAVKQKESGSGKLGSAEKCTFYCAFLLKAKGGLADLMACALQPARPCLIMKPTLRQALAIKDPHAVIISRSTRNSGKWIARCVGGGWRCTSNTRKDAVMWGRYSQAAILRTLITSIRAYCGRTGKQLA
jgi:hypothetical protein